MITVIQLGQVDYATALELQLALAGLRKQSRIPDTLLLLEHPPVITLGRNSRAENMLASRDLLSSRGVEVFECDRGGDVTFHGPGQLVGYPIFDLRSTTLSDLRTSDESGAEARKGPRLTPVQFVRCLEEVLIRTCVEFGVPAQRVCGLTGVWTQGTAPAKVAAIGVHISRGVTSHGFALNLATDMEYFKLIVPCGIADHGVTSIRNEAGSGAAGGNLSLGRAGETVARNFGRVFHSQILWLDSFDRLLSLDPRNVPDNDVSNPSGSDVENPPASDLPANQDVPLQVPEEIRRVPGKENPDKEQFYV